MIDPVCAFHGKRASEHECLYCCLCFKTLTPEECYADENGQKWDMCQDCGRHEADWKAMTQEERDESLRMMAEYANEPSE